MVEANKLFASGNKQDLLSPAKLIRARKSEEELMQVGDRMGEQGYHCLLVKDDGMRVVTRLYRPPGKDSRWVG